MSQSQAKIVEPSKFTNNIFSNEPNKKKKKKTTPHGLPEVKDETLFDCSATSIDVDNVELRGKEAGESTPGFVKSPQKVPKSEQTPTSPKEYQTPDESPKKTSSRGGLTNRDVDSMKDAISVLDRQNQLYARQNELLMKQLTATPDGNTPKGAAVDKGCDCTGCPLF